MTPVWSTACPDWRQRIVERRSLIPFQPLFPEEAKAALEVFGSLRLVDLAGKPRIREVAGPEMLETVAAIFGGYNRATGEQLIREILWMVAKKNAKSTLAAALMLTATLRNWRYSNEGMVLAPTKEVADNSFSPMVDMIRADNDLYDLLHVKENQRIITHHNTGMELSVVAADSESVAGGKKAFVLFDELWQFGKKAGASSMFREAKGGLSVRPEGFVVYTTTQSDQAPKGVFEETLKLFRAIRDGEIVDNSKLPVIYEYPEDMVKSKAFLDPKTFYIPNPSMGRSFPEKDILEDFETSKVKGAVALQDFLAKRLNIEIGGGLRSDGWSGAAEWTRGDDKSLNNLDTLLARSEVIVMSMDGGGLDDLLGVGVIGRERDTKNWLNWNRAYIAPIGMERRKANRTAYEQFIADGDLVLVEKLPDDLTLVMEIVKKVRDSGLLHSVGLDPAGLGILVEELKKIDLTQENGAVGGVKQGVALMGAEKSVARKLVDGTFKHAVQPLMLWCAGNAIVAQTATGTRVARDESGYGKIDPFMATLNCAAIMATNPEPKVLSFKNYNVRFV